MIRRDALVGMLAHEERAGKAFEKMNPVERKAYLRAHPNSRFAIHAPAPSSKPAARPSGSSDYVDVYHGSNAPLSKMHNRGTLYLAKDHGTAQSYAHERVRASGGSPVVSRARLDLSRMASPQQYDKMLNHHYPNDSWMADYPSTAATVADLKMRHALTSAGYHGVRDAYDFDHEGEEIQVHALVHPDALHLS